MTVSKEDLIAAITNLNDLTRRRSIRWHPSEPIRRGSSRGEGYQADYQGRILRVTEYSPPRVQGYYADTSSTRRHYPGGPPEREFVLEIVDEQGVPIYEFPKVQGIADLFASARSQLVDVEGLIKSLLKAQ